jgi:polyhydroxybutyrate depolymerase
MSRSTMLAAALTACLAGACSGSSGRHAAPTTRETGHTTAAPACSPARAATPTAAPETFRFDGHDRAYLLALPPGYDGRTPAPLIFNFHGFLGRKEKTETDTQMGAKGSARGFIVVTPDSLGVQWNAFSAPGEADDYGFVHALLGDLGRRLCVDTDRVYAAGHSNGSAFAAFLVCKAPYEFAALAMVSATTPTTCPPGVTPATIAVAGTADPQVPYAGGTVRGSTIPIPAAQSVIAGYAKKYGCDATPVRTAREPGVDELRYGHCPTGTEVVLDTVVGGTHWWPAGSDAAHDPTDSVAGKTFPATDRILDFLSAHRRAWR